MKAYELLTELLEAFRQAAPEVDFREAHGWESLSRRPGRVLVAGQVEKETQAGADWSARLGFTVYLPAGAKPGEARKAAEAMGTAAGTLQVIPSEIATGPLGPDKTLGSMAMSCTFTYAARTENGGTSGGSANITLDGRPFVVSGWKTSMSQKQETLTAIGEDEPFFRKVTREYTVELSGMDPACLETADGFELVLAGFRYGDCRWKSLSAAGTAVLIGGRREKVSEEE